MSKFAIGDRVRVVQITDVDRDHNDPNRVITDPAHPDACDWNGTPVIGKTGTVTTVFGNDYLDAEVRLDYLRGDPTTDLLSFVDADLEPEV
jgi:hypothetical protein